MIMLAQIYFDVVVFAVLMVVMLSLYVGLGHARTRLPNEKPWRRLWCVVAACCLCGCNNDSGRAEMLEGIIKRQTANIDELTADMSEVVKQRDDARKRLELYEKRENSDGLHSVLVEKP